ncbi:MAG: MerR family transcriptional regulator [Eubacteriales bacterium]
MYKIGEFSKLCKVNVNTLRFYDMEGVFCADHIDESSGYRYYSSEKLIQYNRLLMLKEIGLSLDDIRAILNSKSSDEINEILINHRRLLTSQKEDTDKALSRIDRYFEELKTDQLENFNIIIKDTAVFHIKSRRKLFNDNNEARAEMFSMRINKKSKLFLINYETEYKESSSGLDIEIGIDCDNGNHKIILNSPNLSVFCKTNNINAAYDYLYRFTEKNGYQITGETIEIYYDDNTIEIRLGVHKLSLTNNVISYKQLDRNSLFHPFENDERAIGKWEYADIVSSRKQFNPMKIKCSEKSLYRYLYFLPEGKYYWIFSWSKNILYKIHISHNIISENPYVIETIDGINYMFISLCDLNCIMHAAKSMIWVYKQLDNKKYLENETRIKDKTDYEFINDDDVIGKWTPIDFIDDLEHFNLYKPKVTNALFFILSMEFQKNGEYFITTKTLSGTHIYTKAWTNGFIIDHSENIAEKYIIKTIDSRIILFKEHKCGDYFYGNIKPKWYVFTKI